MILEAYLYSVLYVLGCIALAFVLYKLGLPKPYTRKVIHILVSFVWLILYNFTANARIHFFIVCAVFTVLLFVDYKVKLLPHMSSDSNNAPGTVYYGLSMTVMSAISLFLPEAYIPFGIAVFCTSFGDGFAGVVGQSITRANPKIYGSKSLYGTIANLVLSLAVVFIFNSAYSLGLSAFALISIAILATEIELFAGFGLDNLFLSLGVFALTLSFCFTDATFSYIVPILLTLPVLVYVYRHKSLTPLGTLAAFVCDLAVSVAFGNLGFVVLIAFFGLGTATDKYKEKRKKAGQNSKTKTKKGRNAYQVFANGGIGIIAAILYIITQHKVFLICYVAVMAEALADTAASGIGSSARSVYDIFRFKKCTPGQSGGVSLIGTLASVVASMLIALVAILFGALTLTEALFTVGVAFLGMLFDSLLGSLLQAKYVCSVCGEAIEKPVHCDSPAKLVSGCRFVNNSTVNFLSTVFSFVLSLVSLVIFF